MNWLKFRRIVKWTLLTGFLVVASVIAAISAIVFTEPGTRWVLQTAEQYLPIELGEINGNLLTGLDLGFLEYAVEEEGITLQRYRADKVSFRWQPLALFYSAVSVQSLTADTITVLLPPASDAEPEPMLWPSLALPVRIELGEVQLTNIHVARSQRDLPPQTLVQLQRVAGSSLSLGTFNLRLSDLAVVSEDYSVIASGRIALRYPYDAELDVHWQYELPPTEDGQEQLLLSGQGEIEGDIEQLMLNHALAAPFAIQSRINLTPNLSQPPAAIAQTAKPHMKASNEWPAQALLARWFPVDAEIPVIGGELTLAGWLDEYQAELEGEVRYGDLPPVFVSANTQGNLQQLSIAELLVQLQDAADSTAPATAARVSGTVAWSPAQSWDLALSAADVNPVRYLPEWPGRLQLDIKISGGYSDQGLQVTVEQLDLDGQLRGLNVFATGALGYDGNRWESQPFNLAVGANHVRLNGSLESGGESFNLQWLVNAPLLHQLATDLEGSFTSAGTFQGSLEKPSLQLDMQAEKLRWNGYGVKQLALALTRQAGADYQLTLSADDLTVQQERIKEIDISGSGSVAQHQLKGVVDSEKYGELELALDSSYREQRWQGQFTQLDLRPRGLSRWWLLSSKPMQASAESFDLDELCLTTRSGANWNNRRARDDSEVDADETPDEKAEVNTGISIDSPGEEVSSQPDSIQPASLPAEEEVAAVCSRGQWHATNGMQIEGSIAAVPLRQLRAFLKADVGLAGVLEGDFALQLPSDKPAQAQLNLQTRDGELQYQYADNPREVYRWETAVVSANWQNELLSARFTTDWAQFGDAQADVSLNTSTQVLDGKILVNFDDLAPLAAFLPFADDLSGQLAADIDLRGNLQKPELVGEVTLTQGAAIVPALGLELRELGLTLKSFGGGRIELRSRGRSGDGNLEVSGDLQGLGTPDWLLTGAVKGEKFQLINQTQLQAQFSPSIALRANSQEIRLTGDALIPFARADIKSLPPTATRVSDDVVIEEAGQTNGVKKQTPFYMNINAELGDDVRFNGFGLTSRLSGKMQLIKTPARALLTTGYVDVVDGEYRAYGQALTIDRGRLIFQGPYDNPGLDIRAQRILRGTKDSIVGLEIGGTLQSPTSSVYSDPPLQNEGEAMALLLTGKPLAEASAGDAYVIISAMSGLGMDQGGSITGQIADAFRLDEFAINAEDGLEHSALWVGKYLTERLFVRYIVSLFDQTPNKVGVSYQMSDRLRLEGESGEVQSMDLIYKIER
jgi:translocation and assembly module TamB